MNKTTDTDPLQAAAALLAPIAPPPLRCSGTGLIRVEPHWDSGHDPYDVDCAGCPACRPGATLANAVGQALYRLAALAERSDALQAYAALATIGAAIASAASPAAAIQAFVADATASWNQVVKGAWYRITGKRGSAKQRQGVEGACVWVGETGGGYRAGYGYRAATARVGILPHGSEQAVFVPASAVTRILVPESARAEVAAREAARAAEQAAKAARTPFEARRGQVVAVVHGRDAGKVGRVFWIGSGKAGARYGLDTDVDRKRGRCTAPLWVDAVDCGPSVTVDQPVPAPYKTAADGMALDPVTSAPLQLPGPRTSPMFACDGKHKAGDGCRAAKVAKYAAKGVAL